MKTLVRLSLAVILAAGLTTGLFANGLNLNGNGSKANAMGGAFVGLANDFSAAYWNPAGLAQMTKASLSIYGADILPFGTYQFGLAGIDAKSTFKHYLIPGLGYFQPLGEKIVVGVYLNAPSGAGAVWDGEDLAPLVGGVYDWSSKLGILTISPSIAVKVTEQIMLGATIDINYGMLKMAQPAASIGQYSEDLKGWAVNGTFGLLVKPVEQFSFGVTYKLPFTAKLKGDVTIPETTAAYFGVESMATGTRSANWPSWLAAGIAVKPTDKLTFTADVQHTNWEKLQTIPIAFTDLEWEGFFGEDAPLDQAYQLLWKNTTQFRFGIEYMASKCLALRAGYYFDPNPGPVDTQNVLLPEFKYNFVTLGFGYMSEKVVIDFSVEYGMGEDVVVPPGVYVDAMPGTHGMKIVAPSLSFTYRF